MTTMSSVIAYRTGPSPFPDILACDLDRDGDETLSLLCFTSCLTRACVACFESSASESFDALEMELCSLGPACESFVRFDSERQQRGGIKKLDFEDVFGQELVLRLV